MGAAVGGKGTVDTVRLRQTIINKLIDEGRGMVRTFNTIGTHAWLFGGEAFWMPYIYVLSHIVVFRSCFFLAFFWAHAAHCRNGNQNQNRAGNTANI